MQRLTLDQLPHRQDLKFGPSSWMPIEQGRVDRFAEATEDRQWIHVDPVAASEGPFKTTIAHGYLTLALIPHLMAELVHVECRQALNYGIDKVRFPAPVPTSSRIRLHLTIADVQESRGGQQVRFQATLERQGADKPVCVAEVIYRFLA
jgi:acyl dehydratase